MSDKPKAVKVSAYDCERIPLAQRMNFKMVDPTTCGSKHLTFGMVIVEPHGSCEPGHVHDDQEEIFYCLSGRGIVVADDDHTEIPVAPHEAVFFKPGVYHSLKNPNDIPLQMLWILSPGGWVFDRNPRMKEIAQCPDKARKGETVHTSLDKSS